MKINKTEMRKICKRLGYTLPPSAYTEYRHKDNFHWLYWSENDEPMKATLITYIDRIIFKINGKEIPLAL